MELVTKQDIINAVREVQSFTARKITDTPTDDLAAVNRGYVTANGSSRPPNPIAGQFFLDTSLGAHGKPIWYTSAGWIDATGASV